jgi:hypothetical protein
MSRRGREEQERLGRRRDQQRGLTGGMEHRAGSGQQRDRTDVVEHRAGSARLGGGRPRKGRC